MHDPGAIPGTDKQIAALEEGPVVQDRFNIVDVNGVAGGFAFDQQMCESVFQEDFGQTFVEQYLPCVGMNLRDMVVQVGKRPIPVLNTGL